MLNPFGKPEYGPKYKSEKKWPNLSPSLEIALIAHLRDYIFLMDYVYPNQLDAVKTQAKALLNDCTKESELV